MATGNDILGTLCIALGALLFFMVSGFWLFQLSMAVMAYYIINYGLALRGRPPLSYYIRKQFENYGKY